MLAEETELELGDPRREAPRSSEDFPVALDAAIARHGALMPASLLSFVLSISTTRARQLVLSGAFTVVDVCGYEFLRTYEVQARLQQSRTGSLSKGGRGNRRQVAA